MKISIACSNAAHPVNEYLLKWIDRNSASHTIELVRRKRDLSGGDILFLVSCGEIISAADRASYGASLVLHASDLPRGRGWSPHIWDIAAGATHITLSLLEAEDKVDSGKLWNQIRIPVPPTALWNEINHLLFTAEVELMDFAVRSFGEIAPYSQPSPAEATYLRQRTAEDSRIDAHKSIADQFDLIRVCDPSRYPAFFDHRGQRYSLRLEKVNP